MRFLAPMLLLHGLERERFWSGPTSPLGASSVALINCAQCFAYAPSAGVVKEGDPRRKPVGGDDAIVRESCPRHQDSAKLGERHGSAWRFIFSNFGPNMRKRFEFHSHPGGFFGADWLPLCSVDLASGDVVSIPAHLSYAPYQQSSVLHTLYGEGMVRRVLHYAAAPLLLSIYDISINRIVRSCI